MQQHPTAQDAPIADDAGSTGRSPTAENVLGALWHDVQPRKADPGRVRLLAQALGEHAMQCVADTIGSRHSDLVLHSAAVLETLVSLWSVCGISPEEIWIELHKREQLGSLLMQLNQAQNQVPRRLLKPWRVDSTKLP